MPGTLTDLGVAGKLAVRAIGRKLRGEVESPPDLQEFSAGMERLLTGLPEGVVRDHCWVTLSAQEPPWHPSTMTLARGDQITYFIEGRVYLNRFFDIYVNNALQIWCKIGDEGEIFRGLRNSHSFEADTAGELTFGNYFPNDWIDAQGNRKQTDDVYEEVSGEIRILLIRWASNPESSLQALRTAGDFNGRARAEIERIDRGDLTPEGWRYLWHLGPAEIYRMQESRQGQPCIHCQTHSDVGILQRDVDLPLDENTEISWRWCVEQLPSTIREDSVPSHDYLSLAIEFDNGRDLTYYWSSTLPVGTGYDCPLPNWSGVEYHVVVRSGREGLGQWQDERRNLHADYLQYMGEPPARITRIWLIANSIFQRGEGVCSYEGIRLHGSGSEIRVL